MRKSEIRYNSQKAFLGKLAVAVFLTTIALFTISVRSNTKQLHEDPAVAVAYSWFSAKTEVPSNKLMSKNIPWERFPSDGIAVSDPYAYIRLELRNDSLYDREVIISNNSRNYRTVLLKQIPGRMLFVARHGDRVPIKDSPLRHFKPAFPVVVPTGTHAVYILEYHAPRGIRLNPEVLGVDLWLSNHLFERGLLFFVVGGLMILILLNLFLSLLMGTRYFFSTAVFLFTLCFFYARQSRVLMLVIDPLVYPEWLYAVSISMNCIGALFFYRSLFPDGYNGWEKRAVEILMLVSLALGVAALFDKPWIYGDILNAFSVLILPLLFYYAAKATFQKDYGPLLVVLAFVPWLILMIMDVVIAQFGLRQTNSADFRLWSGLLVSLTLLFVTRMYLYIQTSVQIVPEKSTEQSVPVLKKERNLTLSETCNERFFYRFHQPLDSIIASAKIVENEYADPGIMAVAQIIIGEAEKIKHAGRSMIQIPVIQELFDQDASSYGIDTESTKPVIRIFDYDHMQAARMANMLCAESFDAAPVSDRYRLFSDISAGKVDVLIIDAATCGETGFTLCRLIRAKHSMVQFPILLISDFYEQTMLKRGYAVGVNDFLTRPYDGAELVARIRSLIRLREIERMNQNLEQSEKEKNAFLYFLTHNVNTPLTVLINLVRELSANPGVAKDGEKIGEMEDCVQEINDIVQNVLISFRLTDGRQTLWLEPVDLNEELQRTVREIGKRAEQKQQQLSLNVPETIPLVLADRISVRGILHNLIDNAVKFTPLGGAVAIDVRGTHNVRVMVSDTGPGISPEDQSRLFQRFERLSPRPTGGESSTGLGLHVSHELAVMNGGSLEYKPEETGACFVLTLKRYYGDDV